VQLAAIEGHWAGDLTSETRDINRVAVVLAQGTATSEGNFSLTGTALFESGTVAMGILSPAALQRDFVEAGLWRVTQPL
jgi:hypothetical protein